MPDNSPNAGPAEPKGKPSRSLSAQMATAMELPFVLVSAVAVGGFFGYFLDRWLHTRPALMLVLGGLGFVAGIREVLRRLPASGGGNGASGG